MTISARRTALGEKRMLKVGHFRRTDRKLRKLSYLVAAFKGADVDKPRNFAKSVTVE